MRLNTPECFPFTPSFPYGGSTVVPRLAHLDAKRVVCRVSLGKKGGVVKLTTTAIKAAEPRMKEYTLWDAELTGFGLRVLPSGRKAFIVKYRVGRGRAARQRKTVLGAPGDPYTASQARDAAAKLIASARLGNDPAETFRIAAQASLTVNQFLDKWEKEAAPFDRRTGRRRKPLSLAGDLRRLAIHVRPSIGAMRLADVTPDTLNRLRRDIASGKTARTLKTKPRGVSRASGGDGTAVATLRILKSALAHAVDQGILVSNPASRVKLPPTNQRERFLSGDELARLGKALAACERKGVNQSGLDLIRLLALTGARRGEMEQLRWRDIDFERGTVVLANTKTGRAAWPLSRAALDLLEKRRRDSAGELVFPATSGAGHYRGVNRIWPLVRTRAGLDDVRLHDLRHSFASIGAVSGLGLQIVGKLLGHKQASTTQRYSHLSDDPLRNAADRIGSAISEHLDGRK